MVPVEASAQCPDPVDQVLSFPQDGSVGVPRNVILRSEYPATRDPQGAPHWRVLDSRGNRIDGESSWDGETSTFTPTDSLEPRVTYTVRVTAQATGEYADFSFVSGEESDESSPRFSGLSGLGWEERTEEDLLENCRIARGDAFFFTLDVPTPRDDQALEGLCYYVYRTDGEDRLVGRLAVDDVDGSIHLMQPFEEGEGNFCFRVEVRDLAGRFDGNSRERCVEAVAGAAFADACSVASGRRSGDPVLVIAFVGLLCLAIRRATRGAL